MKVLNQEHLWLSAHSLLSALLTAAASSPAGRRVSCARTNTEPSGCARSDAPPPAPVAQPAPRPAPVAPAPRRLRPPNATPDNPAGIRFQDGGHVPGTGRGDKIPAKYEPGEFVVSNDMIDDNPGLREQLSGLRAETLAARGKTVEEADAKALRYAWRSTWR
jgi:hypothetical protein